MMILLGLCRREQAREILDQFSLLEPGVSRDADDSVMVDLRGELEVMMHELNEERRRSSDLASQAKKKQEEVERKIEMERAKREELEEELAVIRDEAMESGSDEDDDDDAGDARRRSRALRVSLKGETRKNRELQERCAEISFAFRVRGDLSSRRRLIQLGLFFPGVVDCGFLRRLTEMEEELGKQALALADARSLEKEVHRLK